MLCKVFNCLFVCVVMVFLLLLMNLLIDCILFYVLGMDVDGIGLLVLYLFMVVLIKKLVYVGWLVIYMYLDDVIYFWEFFVVIE